MDSESEYEQGSSIYDDPSKRRKSSVLKMPSPVVSHYDLPGEALLHSSGLSPGNDESSLFMDTSPKKQIIYLEDDLKAEFTGYRLVGFLLNIYYLGCILTGGFLYLFCRWFPRLYLFLCARVVPLKEATLIYARNDWKEEQIIVVQREYFGIDIKNVFKSILNHNVPFTPRPDQSPYSHGTIDQTHSLNIYHFNYRSITFILNPFYGTFVENTSWKNCFAQSVCEALTGLHSVEIDEKLAVFGPNNINIPDPGMFKLLMDEILHPFYIFQVFSVILWCFDSYYYYASCIFVISIVSTTMALLDSKRNIDRLRELSHFECRLNVLRNGVWKDVSSEDIVPGDLYEISENVHIFPCDSVLISGDCIVNESMLTGEAVPVFKTPANDMDLSTMNTSSDINSKYYLFGGTKIVRVRGSNMEGLPSTQALAMAVRTGFNTTKGSLVRSMMFPKPNKFQFYEDSFKFLGVLAIIATCGFLLTLIWFIRIKVPWDLIVIRALDLITVVIPPALPAAMSIGTSFAIGRLKKENIYCISPPRVNVCGKLDMLVFDKTGTLTEEGLDVLGVSASTSDGPKKPPFFTDLISNGAQLSQVSQSAGEQDGVQLIKTSDESAESDRIPPLLYALATCHSLKRVHGDLIGDPMDLKMFEFIHWELDECHDDAAAAPTVVRPKTSHKLDMNLILQSSGKVSKENRRAETDHVELGIVRTFEFVSALRRMSVVVKQWDSDVLFTYVKGAPETIKYICRQSSLPEDFEELLSHYAHLGYRVLALAGKYLPGLSWYKAQKMEREDFESDLHFMGFLVFENKLKRETASVLSVLHSAKIRDVMCTGDNILTAVSVAKLCGLVPSDSIVYYASFVDEEATSKTVVWKAIDDERLILDPRTLLPLNFSQDPGFGRYRSGTPASFRRNRTETSIRSNAASHVDLLKRPSSVALSIHDDHDLTKPDYVLAVPGDLFDYLLENFPKDTIERMLVKCKVYARMAPDQKLELIERLQAIDFCVGMCGDGANDCGALKAADVGVSLSEAEASVAAPFTSRSSNIECILKVIREGRAALVTSFSCFKYMAAYSLIQFCTVGLNFTVCINMGDFQYLFIDLFLILPLALFMGRTEASREIYHRRPTASLVSRKVLLSLIGCITIMIIFQVGIYFYARAVNLSPQENEECDLHDTVSYENTVLFLFSCFQYIWVAIIFSVGKPFRASMLTNSHLVVAIIVLVALTTYFVLFPDPWTAQILGLEPLSDLHKIVILVVAAINFVVVYFGERAFFPFLNRLIGSTFYTKRKVENPYIRESFSQWFMNGRWKALKKRKRYKVVNETMEEEVAE